ncbi:MAG: hypothetical protein IPI29_08570 [Ignavibacteria bacterium]|nr:hypothetical protein [Ignavibacteria bacterium]
MASYAEVNIPLRLDPVLDVAKINVFVKALKASLGQYGKDIKPPRRRGDTEGTSPSSPRRPTRRRRSLSPRWTTSTTQ